MPIAHKKAIVLGLIMLLFIAAFLHPAYRVSVNGAYLPELYSSAALRAGMDAAAAAAEELMPGDAVLPSVRLRRTYRLRPAPGRADTVSDALLLGTKAIVLADSVELNALALGTVDDGASLLESLRAAIRADMPVGASVGNLSGSLRVRPVYARAGGQSEEAAMLANITALAPAFYLDENGRLVTGG